MSISINKKEATKMEPVNQDYSTINPFNYGITVDDYLLLCQIKVERCYI